MIGSGKTKKSIFKVFLSAFLVIAPARVLAEPTTLQCLVPLIDGSVKLTLHMEDFRVGWPVKAYEGNHQKFGDLRLSEISKRRIEIVSWKCPLGDKSRNPITCGISINRFTGDAEMYQVFPAEEVQDLWNEEEGRVGGFTQPQKFSSTASNCSVVERRF